MRNQNDGSWLRDTSAILKPKPLPPPPMNFQRPPPSWRLPRSPIIRSPLLPTYPPPRFPPPLVYPASGCEGLPPVYPASGCEGLLPTPGLADLPQSPNTWPPPTECPWVQNHRSRSSDNPNISEIFSAGHSSLPPSPTFGHAVPDHSHLLSQEMNGLYAPHSIFSRPNIDVPCDWKKPLSENKSQPRLILAPQLQVPRVVTPVSESTLDPNCQPFAPARQPLVASNEDPPPPGTEEPPTAYTPSPEEFPPLSEPSASTPDWMSRTASEHDQLLNPSLSFLDDSQEIEEFALNSSAGSVNQFLPRSLRPPLLPTPSNFPPFGPRNVKTVGSEGSGRVRSHSNGNGLSGFGPNRLNRSQFADAKETFGLQDHFKPSSYFGSQSNSHRFYNYKPVIYNEGGNIQNAPTANSFIESSNDLLLATSKLGIREAGASKDFDLPSRPANVVGSISDYPAQLESLLKSSVGQVSSASVHLSTTNLPPLLKPSGTKDDIIPMGPLSNARHKPSNDRTGFSFLGPQGPASPVDPTEDAEVMDPRNLLSSAPLIEDFPVPDEYRVSKFIGEKLPKINIRQERTELLFFTFYSNLGDALQLVAASLLFERGWRYHKQDCIWLARWPGVRPEEKTSQYEKGLYQYFDVGTWRRIPGWFKLEYSQLADKTLVPEDLKTVYSRYNGIFSSVAMAADKDPFLTLCGQDKEEFVSAEDCRLLHCLL